MSFDYMLFSKDVTSKRKKENLSLRDLEKISDVKVSSLSRIENKIGNPDIKTFGKILKWLDEPATKYFNQLYEGSKYEIITENLYRKINN